MVCESPKVIVLQCSQVVNAHGGTSAGLGAQSRVERRCGVLPVSEMHPFGDLVPVCQVAGSTPARR